MTAILSINTLAAPLGFLLAGQILERWGVDPIFFGVAAGCSLLALVFASITFRYRDDSTAVPGRRLRPDRRRGRRSPTATLSPCLRSRHRTRTPRRATSRARSPSSEGVEAGERFQTMLGATGTGKTATMAWIIEQGPAADARHRPQQDARRAACNEFREFFPHNAVEYFVSYYDYYQPEAYVPQADLYIEKDSSQNDDIARLRLAATSSLFTRGTSWSSRRSRASTVSAPRRSGASAC